MKSVVDAIFSERFEALPKIDISTDIFTELWRKNDFKDDIVYVVDGCVHIEDSRAHVSDGAIAVCDGGIVIENADGAYIEGLTVKGSVRVINSKNVLIKNCKIQSDDVAVSCDSDGLSIYKSKLCAPVCISSSANDLAVQDCELVAEKLAVRATGIGAVIRDNNVVATGGYGIEIFGATNALVAKNNVIGMSACAAISVSDSFNCAVVLNSATAIAVNDNKNVYVIKNTVDGAVDISNNNYLTADGNVFVGNDVKTENNGNFVGDNVTDVNARVEFGANEDILPHTNKDLFIGMERREKVSDVSLADKYSLENYIRYCAERGDEVIVPPGAYAASKLVIEGEHNNTAVYAYGVLLENDEYELDILIQNTDHVNVCGITIGYTMPASMQVHVVKKLGDNKLLVIPSAGYVNNFAKSDSPEITAAGGYVDIYAAGKMYNWGEFFGSGGNKLATTVNSDGTMTVEMVGMINGSKISAYDGIEVGDILACRFATDLKEKTNINLLRGGILFENAADIKLRDVVTYSHSGDVTICAETGAPSSIDGDFSGIVLERVHITVDSGRVIDKATYDKYVEYEKQYGVDFELRQDGNGLYRGAAARMGSCDATHMTLGEQGVSAIACIFENMNDDGTNQRGDSARLHAITNNGDGTVTVVYKNMASEVRFGRGNKMGGLCKPFDVGQTVYIYNSEGVVLCDGPAISRTVSGEIYEFLLEGRMCRYRLYTVTVAESSIRNWNALYHANGAKYHICENPSDETDQGDNHYVPTEKIFVDNLSQNSANYTFDNVLIQNVRSRGIVIKTEGVTVKNCTLRNLAQTALKLSNELFWGESTVPRKAKIYGCLFDNVGYYGKDYSDDDCAPLSIYIELGGEFFNENGMCCRDVLIDGCKFVNNGHRTAIHVQNAQGITIRNCDFGNITSGLEGCAISLDKAMNVSVYDNAYHDNIPLKVQSVKNVTDKNGNLIVENTN